MKTTSTQLVMGALEIPKLEAMVELMYLAAYADGVVSREERDVFERHVLAESHGQISAETVRMMVTMIEKALATEKREQRFESIRRRLGDERMRKEALRFACRVVQADDYVDPREAAWLLRAAEALEMTAEEALAALEAEAGSSGVPTT